MTWTFDPALATDRDKVRFRIGDTDTNRQQLANETIDTLLALHTTVVETSIQCCKALLAKIARDVDRNVVGISANRSQVTQHYQDLIRKLTAERAGTASVSLTGVSRDEIQNERADTDFVKPTFSIGMSDRHAPHEDPWDA